MRKIVFILLLLCTSSTIAKDTDPEAIILERPALIGRWTEVARTTIDGEKINLKHKDSYIFKDNLAHRGEVTQGVILYDVTGRYLVEGDSIRIAYFDLLGKRTDVQKNELMILSIKVLSINKDEIYALVKDHKRPHYHIRLKKTIVK